MNTVRISQIQALEARQMMTAAVATLTTSVITEGNGQQLSIQGTTGNDVIHVTQSGNSFTVTSAAGFNQTFTGAYDSLKIKGGAGNDQIIVDASVTLPVYLYGDAGNDTLGGGSGDDFLYGGAGTNALYGNAGRDTLTTLGSTADSLSGGAGEDFFWADNNTNEKILDADAYETASSVNRVAAFTAETYATGSVKSYAISKDILGQRFRDPDLSSSSFSYKAFSNDPLFSAAGPTADEVKQGAIGDCYYLSTLAATAQSKPDVIRDMITDLGDGTYAVRFKTAAGATKYYRVDNDVAVYTSSPTNATYAQLGADDAMWVAIAEKAYTYFRKSVGTYNSISSGWMGEVFTALGETNQVSLWKNQITSGDDYLNWVQQQLDAGYTVTMGVINPPGNVNLISGHAYQVVGITTNSDGTRSLIVRNPWGIDGYRTTDGVQDGYVTLSSADAYTGIDAFVAGKAA